MNKTTRYEIQNDGGNTFPGYPWLAIDTKSGLRIGRFRAKEEAELFVSREADLDRKLPID